MRRGWTVAGLGLVGLLLGAGCDDENAPQAPPWPEEDGSLPEDAGAEDADTPDAADGGLLDPDGGAVSQCEGDVLEYPAANAPGRPFSASIRGNSVDLVYLVAAGGGTLGASKAQGLQRVSFDTTGEASEPEDVVNVGVDSYWKTRDPALVAQGDALDLFFTSNSAGPFELFHQDLAGDGSPARETTNTGRNEYGTVAGAFGSGVAVVYSDETAQLDAPAAVAFKRPGALPEELVPESVGVRATRLAFAEVGDGAGAVAFVSDRADARGIYFQGVAASGAAQGELVTLSEHVGSASSADVARGREGAAVVYTEAPGGNVHQLRFRRVDGGHVSESVRSLTSANQDLLEIALAAYSQGYVVAYRRVGGPGSAAASIYLLVIDAEGNVGGARLVRTVTPSGRGLEVMVGNDGRFVVIWSDTEMVTNPDTQRSETELRVRAARVLCAG